MSTPLLQFKDNLHQARHVCSHSALHALQHPNSLIPDELLRASLVSGVSALDHYIHELVRVLMIETALGKRPQTPAFGRFSTTVSLTMRAAQGTRPEQWMDEAVRQQHSYQTFQQPARIADAVRLVWSGKLWETVASQLGKSSSTIVEELKLVVLRRNCIVHEADRNPLPPHDRWPISQHDVISALQTIDQIVSTIDNTV